jgi:hypothetical protein
LTFLKIVILFFQKYKTVCNFVDCHLAKERGMLHNNLDLIVAQANQHCAELRAAAEHSRLVGCIAKHQPGLVGQALTYVGELLVTSGEWLKAQGELPAVTRTVITQ